MAPVPVGIGAGLALERGRGDRSLPTRPAIIGALAAVAGVVGCFGLIHGIDDAIETPARSGQVWDVTAVVESRADLQRVVRTIERDRSVTAAAIVERTPVDIDGKGVPIYSMRPIRGNRRFTPVAGRGPRGRNEIALRPATARALHKRVGDRVTITSANRPPVPLRVVGLALLPQGAHTSFDQGAWATTPAARLIAGGAVGRVENGNTTVAVTHRGATPNAVLVERLRDATGVGVEGLSLPQDVLLLRDVRALPKALAGFLVLLGVAAVGHALVTAVRRRRQDLAILRALGFTPRQAALTIASQACTVGGIGLIFGIPLGVLLGRATWRWVAEATPLHYVPPNAVAVIVVAIPATIVLANLLAAVPARRAAHIRPAHVLRTE